MISSFASKIRGTAEQVGTRVQFSRSIPDAVAKARDEAPALIIADLNASGCDALELARALKGDDALAGDSAARILFSRPN